MNPFLFLALSVVIFVCGALIVIWLAGRIRRQRWPGPQPIPPIRLHLSFDRLPHLPWPTLLELLAIGLWAVWVGRDNFNLDPHQALGHGNDDFLLAVFPYYPLTRLGTCGACVMWNGLMNGGAPTFADSLGALFHPVMAPLIVGFGVLNGIKLAMIAALLMGGWAQWWIAKVMRLGRFTRVWVAFFAVTAGHLAGPLQGGNVGIVFSTAAASLIIAPTLSLAINGRRRDAIVLGLLLGQALLAGQGYLQMGIGLAFLPAVFILLIKRDLRLYPLWKEYALALGIALLIAMPFVLPWSNLVGQINRPTDPRTVQSIEYLPLNLVISDMNYFRSDVLEKIVSPATYLNYIGWIPIILGAVALRLIQPRANRLLAFFLTAIFLIYVVGSGLLFSWFKNFLPDFLTAARCPPFVVGLAVPLILALAAWGLDLLLKKDWPRITLGIGQSHISHFDTRWLAGLAAALAIIPVYHFNQELRIRETWDPNLIEAAESLHSTEARWVDPVYGNWTYVAASISANIKVTNAYRIWDLKDHPAPPASIKAGLDSVVQSDPNYLGAQGPVYFVQDPNIRYATINSNGSQIPCTAIADGGHIDVTCDSPMPGQLQVFENNWPGWTAWIDGAPTVLNAGQWLSVNANSGQHVYQFRFFAWDVVAGLIIAVAGWGLCIWLWRRLQPEPRPTVML